MAKPPTNHRAPWTPADIKKLETLAGENTPARVAALKLGRTPASVQQKASDQGISLKPTNQSPYGTQKRKK